MTDIDTSAEAAADPGAVLQDETERRKGLITLEICFLAFIGVLVFAAFLEATSYSIVSSRTPFVIMVPLFALIVVQGYRLGKRREDSDFVTQLRRVCGGGHAHFSKVLSMCCWMVALMVLILIFGHLVGIAAFSFALMWWVAKEKFLLAACVAVGTTFALYVLFEIGFDVELYKGMIYRYFAGYRLF
ncbi:hypothetical protein [Puniceibacterium sp. IMCC21224]|uniref:hypothetical protein n=1 Tax=Puniceibacterium sp. IMCC21224 TaxID=1618204 RepID=UPI00064D94B2|nr:hypothetical protein [Puniceibacterium sp. IMCC21224]KMK65041.1 Tripartite tricarboxylate transporter TctB family [Puniceibacterium sp. IMCC21224]